MNSLIILKNIKNSFFKKKNIYYLIIILIIFLLDRYSKLQVIENLENIPYLVNNFLNIDLIWNTGIGFGFFSSQSALFYNLITILIGLVISILIYFFLISKNIDKMIYSIIIGGALGNFYDRFVYKAVPDFLDLHYNNFHWFIFNVADIFITIGIVILFINGLLKKK